MKPTDGPSSLQLSATERIVFADKDFAVVMKFPGEVCEDFGDSSSLSRNIKPLLEEFLGHKISFCQCVNRLDRPVSGLCVLALSRSSCAALSAVFSSGKVRKIYLALTEKPDVPLEATSRELSGWILFNRKTKKSFMVPAGTKGARTAAMNFRVLGEGERYLFVRAEPHTGRTHQIRCQLSDAGLHIKGDVKYGAHRTERGGGIRLHAWSLDFPHPRTGELLEFTAPPPLRDALWEACLSAAGNPASGAEN